MKEGDVLQVRWKVLPDKSDPYWCFDGKLIASRENGRIVFRDTYWAGGGEKRYSMAEIRALFTFKKLCNLDDVVQIHGTDRVYYSPSKIIDLSSNHGHRPSFCVKKGTKKSRSAILKEIDQRIEKAKHDISWAQGSIERLNEKRAALLLGNMDVML